MSQSKKRKLERLRGILQTPYVRLPLILLAVVATGLAVVYIFVFIFLVYALATSIGNPNAQLVVGMISALGTVASATVAYLLYRNTTRGANITLSVEDPLEIEMNPTSRHVNGEFDEQLIFSFPVLFSNSGPRGGAVVSFNIAMTKPAKTIPTVVNKVPSADTIDFFWNAGNLTLKSGALPVKDNETISVTANLNLSLKEKDSKARPPTNHFIDIQQKEPYFQFMIDYKVTAGSGKIVAREKVLNIRPKFIEDYLRKTAIDLNRRLAG